MTGRWAVPIFIVVVLLAALLAVVASAGNRFDECGPADVCQEIR